MSRLIIGVLLNLFVGVGHAYTFLSQNMAEFSDADPRRIGKLLDRIVSQKPDIIFFQEAGDQTLRLIRSTGSIFPRRQHQEFI